MLRATVVMILCLSWVAGARAETPREVEVLIYVADVYAIDDATQGVSLDVMLWLSWRDPSLARPGSARRSLPLDEIWHPDVQILNGSALRAIRPQKADVYPDGRVRYRQRYAGELFQPFDFTEFPLDRQKLEFRGVSALRGGVTFVPDPHTSRAPSLSITNWSMGEASLRIEPYAAFGSEFSSFVFEMPARRYLSFYSMKVILPLALIVFMSWTVFWISPAQMGPQLSVAVTSVLTVIAYRFALGRSVPNLPYLTRMDWFILGASVLVFLALLEVVVVSRMADTNRLERAELIDRSSRWIFPAVFAAVLVGSFLTC